MFFVFVLSWLFVRFVRLSTGACLLRGLAGHAPPKNRPPKICKWCGGVMVRALNSRV